jgi:hypothetical protein
MTLSIWGELLSSSILGSIAATSAAASTPATIVSASGLCVSRLCLLMGVVKYYGYSVLAIAFFSLSK